MNRREFLNCLGLGGVGLLCTPSAMAVMTERARIHRPPKLMFDGRYPLAMDYAMGLRDRGISRIDTQGDLVGLWYRDPDAFRLQRGQVMLGYTTWSDYQALRILIDDARLGRDTRLDRPGRPGRLTLLQQKPGQTWPEALAGHFPSTFEKRDRTHLVTWLALTDPAAI